MKRTLVTTLRFSGYGVDYGLHNAFSSYLTNAIFKAIWHVDPDIAFSMRRAHDRAIGQAREIREAELKAEKERQIEAARERQTEAARTINRIRQGIDKMRI